MFSFDERELSIVGIFRDRPKSLEKFINNVPKYIKNQYPDAKIVIIQQDPSDDKSFNRGKLRNVGFLELQKRYPSKNVCFHDIGPIPITEIKYDLPITISNINHVYGHNFCLGGIYIVPKSAYMRTNGHSNEYWTWGFEDTDFQKRCEIRGINIDNSKMISKPSNMVLEMEGFENTEAKYDKFEKNTHRMELDGLNNCTYRVEMVQMITPDIVMITVRI